MTTRSRSGHEGTPPSRREARLLHGVVAALLVCALSGCRGSPRSVLVNPDAVGADMGTLVTIADIRTATTNLVKSLGASREIARLRSPGKPLPVLLGELRQFTTITNFDKALFRNHLLSKLQEADRDGAYRFLDRPPAVEERERLEEGVVRGRGDLAPWMGAELVLHGEIREIYARRRVESGGEERRRTVQYALSLHRVDDGALLWSDAHEVVKKQVVGVAYQ